jgi:DNA-binding response OmpR family regulator
MQATTGSSVARAAQQRRTVTKPFDIDEVVEAIHAAIDRRRGEAV